VAEASRPDAPPPLRLERWPVDDPGPRCARGTARPRAIAWFGFSAFWGHLRHLLASAIATDNVDSRQWMIPEAPDVLLDRVVDVLAPRGAERGKATLAEASGGEVWIDFVADTGDDVTVSEVVARTLARPYEVEDPERPGAPLVLPRGDILFLGGDVAYPVATVREITRRLLDPWNRVLEPAHDGAPRVLLAVPGNHDWYDGLDGFARLCQAPCAFEGARRGSDPLHPEPDDHPVLAWAEAFARGDQVEKPSALALAGYVPVQRTSYFRLPLAPGLDLFAVDRQLKRVDERQVAYFSIPGAPARLVVVPDPARAWGESRPHGVQTLASLGIEMAKTPTLLFAGDIHHYERSAEGPSIHVVAGGGGAFLQGARIAGGAAYPVQAEFPGPRASWKLLRELPLYCARGGAGFLLLAVFAVANALALATYSRAGVSSTLTVALAIGLIVAFGTAMLVGWRRHRMVRVVPFATALGLAIGALPVLLGLGADAVAMRVLGAWGTAGRPLAFAGALVVATVASGFLFGAMLLLIGRLGLNHAQAYAALGGAGFKHLVRLRVRATGNASQVDAWVIGVVDPIAHQEPVLVDFFRFAPHEPPSAS
jgi:hypothetical protein